MLRGTSLSARVARGSSLLIGTQFVARGLDLLGLMVLARLLTPADFGIVALAMVILGLVDVVSNIQLSTALIRKPTISDAHFDTAFTLGVLRGLFSALIIVAGAEAFAALLDEPALAHALLLVAVAPILDGLRNPRFVLFDKALDYSVVIRLSVIATITSLVVAILAVLLGAGFWALILGAIASRGLTTVATHFYHSRWPHLTLSEWREFVAFGGWLAGANVLAQLNYKADTVILGAFFDAAKVGQYNVGDRIASLPNEVSGTFSRTIYAGLSTITDDTRRRSAAYYKAQSIMTGLMLPVGVGLSLVAPEFVLLLVGAQWGDAIPVVQFVAPVIAIGMLTSAVQSVAMVEGATRALFIRNLINLVFRIPVILAGLWAFGYLGLIGARVITSLFYTATSLHVAARVLGNKWFEPIKRAWRSFVACAMMALAVLLLSPTLPTFPSVTLTAATTLIAKAAVGAAVYLTVSMLLWHVARRPDGAETLLVALGNSALRWLHRRWNGSPKTT